MKTRMPILGKIVQGSAGFVGLWVGANGRIAVTCDNSFAVVDKLPADVLVEQCSVGTVKKTILKRKKMETKEEWVTLAQDSLLLDQLL
jgi:hypothetical protein